MASRKFRIALLQFAVSANKAENLAKAANLIKEASCNGAKIVALPECCNSPYGNQYFTQYAEELIGESANVFSMAAATNKVYLIAGSIPEQNNGKYYNTSMVFAPDGKILATYRKLHLFDIDVPGRMTFQESKTLTPGNSISFFDTPYCRIGLGICYDIRFAELAQLYSKFGCKFLFYPGAFNMTTGPAHWHLLNRARAVDNQIYVASISPARDENSSYVAYGHSLIVNPWGEVIASADEKESIVYADIDMQYLQEVRSMIPITLQKRDDIYKLEAVNLSHR